jgi:carboxymethylenebutenolidase
MQPIQRNKASDYPQEILRLFDRYIHGDIDRRGFLEGAQKFAFSAAAAAAMLESLRPNFAWAQQVPPNDPRIRTEQVTVPSPEGNGSIQGLFARPANLSGRLPGILVIHENRGLNPYIEDVARRLATANFIAFAPDALTSVGGYPGDEQQAAAAFGRLDRNKIAADFLAAARWLKSHPNCTGKIGAVGFCFGGGVVNNLAVTLGADLAAGVPYYGAQPAAADVAKIKAPLLIHYAGNDARINAGWPAFEAALKAANATYQMHMYPNVEHGFHNDTTPRYDEAAAKLSWERTLAHFNTYLR